MTIIYPVRAIHEDDEDIPAAILDATGRALEVDEIVSALNGPPCECGQRTRRCCGNGSRRDDCPNLGEAKCS